VHDQQVDGEEQDDDADERGPAYKGTSKLAKFSSELLLEANTPPRRSPTDYVLHRSGRQGRVWRVRAR
jgi:hypothetical protein